MEFLLPPGYGPVNVRYEVPAHYTAYRIPAARPCYVEGDFGNYLTQRISATKGGLQRNLFTMLSDFTLDPYSPNPADPIHFMLEGNLLYELAGFGKAWLRQGICNLFYVPGGIRHHAHFSPGFYHSFHVDVPSGLLQGLPVHYPEVMEVLDRFRHDSPAGVQQHNVPVTPAMERMLNEMITDCPAAQPMLDTFLRSVAFRLLLLYVQGLPHGDILPPGAVRLMKEMKADILQRLQEPLTTTSMAAKFHLSESTLRRQFLQYFGEPIRHFMLAARIDRAKALLDEGLPIGDVAYRTGYSDISSFTRAFKHYLGYTPSAYKRRRR